MDTIARAAYAAVLQAIQYSCTNCTLARLPSFFSSRSEVHTRSQTKGESSSLHQAINKSQSIDVGVMTAAAATAAAAGVAGTVAAVMSTVSPLAFTAVLA
jgi:hypothetical protein